VKLREEGTAHWVGNVHSNNESGFNALPAGWITGGTTPVYVGQLACFFSSTKSQGYFPIVLTISLQGADCNNNGISLASVRYIKN
jgi:hypothetical protein